ncbi:serine/threonine-protein kinase [Polyangium sp. y55x31]|uniref:protein kinase domain-containing protein n=1 Tax=Polyangium sp. y55x31 TaxID=3042688 RepID=UPI002482617D|nr:serine/threonine-protein kinase [Polyangium sp. y55x31]MDI1482803.1 serine/threonine-protein kinase [Polyangium sp. y55x31]
MSSEIFAWQASTLAASASSEDASADESSDVSDDAFLREVARIDDVPVPRKREDRAGKLVAHRYQLVSLLGSGGQGAVWEAEDTLTGERVAVKVLRSVSATCAARAQREIAVLRLLRLPGVVRLVDEGLQGDSPFLVTERITGRPFPGVSVPCSWEELEPVLVGLLETLARIHAVGIVHRDLKPDNVLVGPDKRPVVLDFGLSSPSAASRDPITDAGQIVGTLSYIAPEQFREQRATARTDLYAVGVMAYLALTGRVPHEKRDMCAFILSRLNEPAPNLRTLVPELPFEVSLVLDQLVATNPADRPRSAAEVVVRLRDRLIPSTRTSGIPSPLRPILTPPRGRQPPRTVAALQAVFSGPNRLLYLQEDAARVLFARTAGEPALVARELEAWVRAGLGRWDGERVAVDREAIEVLEAGLVVATHDDTGGMRLHLTPRQWDLVAWVTLAFPHADVGVLAEARGDDPEDVEAELDELVRAEVLRPLPEGKFLPAIWPDVEEFWTVEAQQRAHRALAAALPLGAPGRLIHLLKGAADDRESAADVTREVVRASQLLAAEGRTTRATLLLTEGLRMLRQNPQASREDRARLFASWVEIALAENTSTALDRVLYELCRPGAADDPALAHLAALVRAALAAGSWTPRAVAAANEVPPFSDPALELRRQGVRVLASRRGALAVEEATLAEVAAWAEAGGDRVAQARAASWVGRLRYRQGRFDEAAACHLAAAAGEAWPVARLWALLFGASALLEAFRFEEAKATAKEALALARHCRHAVCAGRAEWILRSVAYRMGAIDGGPVDLELVEATPLVGGADLEALVCLTEAAVAHRAGDRALARDLAGRAYRVWRPSQERVGSLLCAGLSLAHGGALPTAEVQAVVEAARTCPIPGVGVQALALLAAAGVPVTWGREEVDRLAALVPLDRRRDRMDVLSVEESLERLSRA